MFTFVTLAFMIIIGLTAFVPGFRGMVQWLYKKTALVIFVALLSIYRCLLGLVALIPMLIAGVFLCLGRIIVACSSWSLAKCTALDDLADKQTKAALKDALRLL